MSRTLTIICQYDGPFQIRRRHAGRGARCRSCGVWCPIPHSQITFLGTGRIQ